MTDVRVLLADAAPHPAVRPDFAALVAAGRRRNLARRIRLGLAALALVAGVGGPASNALAPASRPQQLSTERTGDVTLEQGADDAVTAAAPNAPTRDAAPDMPPPKDSSASAATLPPPLAEVSPSTTIAKETAGEGCELTGRTEGGATVGPWYGNVSGWPTCSYRATEAGGYIAQGTWRIEIRRGNESTTLMSGRDAHCAAVGTIQPGDEVTVTLPNDASDPDERFIRVGPAHHC